MSRAHHTSPPSAPAWGDLPTEARHPDTLTLDAEPAEQIVRRLLEEDRHGIELALGHSGSIATGAEWIAASLESGGTLVFAGAGTSGRLGVLEAAECPPTFGVGPEQIRAVIAGGNEAMFAAREGAEDRADDGRAAVADLDPSDVLVGISASSVTAYVRGALEAARERGSRTVLLTCAAPSPRLDAMADLVIALDTGPEVLTGSTRLKAGSATKAVLNALTTTAMVAVGKVYGNLMVDLRAGSAKLRDRAVRIVASAVGLEHEAAAALLAVAGGEVKVAIVMGRAGVNRGAAVQLLQEARGHVRRALARQPDEA